MKILVNVNEGYKQLICWIDYIRNICPLYINDLVLIDTSHSDEIYKWASEQADFTYVYFEEELTCSDAFNQVIEGLKISEDILITDTCHIPLIGAIERLSEGLSLKDNCFATGPISNSFENAQHAEWSEVDEAIKWSEYNDEKILEEVLYLQSSVILFDKSVIKGADTFDKRAVNLEDMVIEKCIREFLGHGRMFVCRNSGFWDTRGNDNAIASIEGNELIEEKYGIHYLNIRGNDVLIDTINDIQDLNNYIRVLEIGCDCGGNLFRIRKMFGNAKLYGTDINEKALRFASEFSEVKVNNIEDHNLSFETNNFDLIIFSDVLEHLRDPLGTLIYCRSLLKEGGRIVASIPNLMNIEVMKLLLDGDFPYADYGLLDKTHIHMFTYNEIIRMFVDEAGYKIEDISMNGELNGENELLADKLVKLGKAEKFMYQAFQYQVVAKL